MSYRQVHINFTGHRESGKGISDSRFSKIVPIIDSVFKQLNIPPHYRSTDLSRWLVETGSLKKAVETLIEEFQKIELVIIVHPDEKNVEDNVTLGMVRDMKKDAIILLDENLDRESIGYLKYKGFDKIKNCKFIVYEDIGKIESILKKVVEEFFK